MRRMIISKMSTIQCLTRRQTAYYALPHNRRMTTVDNKLRQTTKVAKRARYGT